LGLSFLANNYSLSANMEYLPSGYVPDDTDEGRILLERGYVAALVQHYDSILAADGCVVDMETSIVLPNDSTWRWFLERYFTNVVVDSNGIRYDRRPCPEARSSSGTPRYMDHGRFAPTLRQERATEPRAVHLRVIHAATPMPGLTVSLYNVSTGNLVARSTACSASQADCLVRFRCPTAGRYKAVLSDPCGQFLTMSIMVN
jgi:hypothetical protein